MIDITNEKLRERTIALKGRRPPKIRAPPRKSYASRQIERLGTFTTGSTYVGKRGLLI
jgi:hypothetical protein